MDCWQADSSFRISAAKSASLWQLMDMRDRWIVVVEVVSPVGTERRKTCVVQGTCVLISILTVCLRTKLTRNSSCSGLASMAMAWISNSIFPSFWNTFIVTSTRTWSVVKRRHTWTCRGSFQWLLIMLLLWLLLFCSVQCRTRFCGFKIEIETPLERRLWSVYYIVCMSIGNILNCREIAGGNVFMTSRCIFSAWI